MQWRIHCNRRFLRTYKLECILLHNTFPSATVFSFYIFTCLIFRKLNKPQSTRIKQQNLIRIRFSFILRYFKVFQVFQMFTCGLSDLLSCGRFVGCFCIARILVSSEHKLRQNSNTCIVSCIYWSIAFFEQIVDIFLTKLTIKSYIY
jgi:hypothetical protein